MMQHPYLRILCVLPLFLLFPLLALGFQQDGGATQDTVAVQKPEPISINRLVGEIEELRELIALNSEKIIPGVRLKRIDSLYPVYRELMIEEQEKAEIFIDSNPNRQKIDNLIKRWEEYRVQLTAWETEITQYVERNLRLLESFKTESGVWDLTYEQAKEQGVPAELLSNVQDVRNDLREIREQAEKNNYTYLRLQTRINRLRQSTVEAIGILYTKKSSETYDLFHQRQPPIWQVSFKAEERDGDSGSKPETFADPSTRISELYQTHKDKLFFLLAFGLGLIGFIWYIRRQLIKVSGREAATRDTAESYLIFKVPVILVIFLLFFVARLQLLTGTRFMGDILISALLVCSIILINHRVAKRFRGLIYLSVFFVFLDTIKTYVWFASNYYRLYMFMEAILMAGVIFYFTRPYLQTKNLMNTSLSRFMIRLVPLAYILSAVSFGSNLLGYTNLSDLTLRIVIQSGIAAIIAYGLYLAFNTLSLSWLEQRYLRSETPEFGRLAFLKKRTEQFNRFAVIILFVVGFLNIIDEMRNVTEFITSVMTEPYIVGNLSFTMGSIFMFLLILAASYILSRLITFLISDQYGALRFFRLPKGVPTAISLVIRYIILVFGVILALSYLNVDLSQFNLMAGALGLGIGFGLQNVISNFVSGLILVFERPILPGDTIEVNNLYGKVNKIGVRSSSIRTYDGAEVVVPNSNLISNDLINWTLSDSIKRVQILIGTTYDADPNQVLEILKGCAEKFDFVLKDREPVVHFIGFGESSLDFRLWFWVPFEIGLKAQSDVNIEIFNQFANHNIVIPYPQRDIHIKDLPPSSGDTGI